MSSPRLDRPTDVRTGLLGGAELTAAIRADVTARAAALSDLGVAPRLAVVTATDDE